MLKPEEKTIQQITEQCAHEPHRTSEETLQEVDLGFPNSVPFCFFLRRQDFFASLVHRVGRKGPLPQSLSSGYPVRLSLFLFLFLNLLLSLDLPLAIN